MQALECNIVDCLVVLNFSENSGAGTLKPFSRLMITLASMLVMTAYA